MVAAMVGFVKRFRERMALRRDERRAGAAERAKRKADAEARRQQHRRDVSGGGPGGQ